MALLAVSQIKIQQSAGSVASLTTSGITTTSGNLLVACLFCETNKIGGTPITDSNGNTWTSAVAAFGSATFAAMFYVPNCVGGAAHTFTFTPTANDFISIALIEVSAAATSSVIGSTGTSITNTASHSSGNITSNGTVPEIFIGGWNPATSTATLPANASGLKWAWNWINTTATKEGALLGWRIVDPSITDAFTVTGAVSAASPIMIAGFKAASALPAGGGSFGAAYA